MVLPELPSKVIFCEFEGNRALKHTAGALALSNTPNTFLPCSLPSTAQVPKRPDLIKRTPGSTVAKVSLADCLACSGCVTSAETVLITQQSVAEFKRALADKAYAIHVVSIAPQALASIAAAFDLDSVACFQRLTTYFQSLGVRHILDTGGCSSLALMESCREFVERLDAKSAAQGTGVRRRPWVPPPASRAVSVTRTELVRDFEAEALAGGSTSATADHELGDGVPSLPILCSACPGWVCYAEKTVPEALPYMSSVKSPQQMLGALVKCLLAGGSGLECKDAPIAAQAEAALPVGLASRIYHTTIMPCYDKKLEASRLDFFWEGPPGQTPPAGTREIDCVLASREVVEMIREEIGHLAGVAETPRHGPSAAARAADTIHAASATADIDVIFCSLNDAGTQFVGSCAADGESDGYVDTLARYCALKLGGEALPDDPLPFTTGRNPDFREFTLRIKRADDGSALDLGFAVAYGFRNIQTVTSRMKRGARTNGAPWHYVEVMACPSGCVNGGGQQPLALPEATGTGVAAVATTRVSLLLHKRHVERPWESAGVAAIESALASRGLSASQVGLLLRTRYHHVPKLETTLIRW